MSTERDLYLGIDPGLSGGLALLDESGAVVDVSKMPATERDIADYFREFAVRIHFAVIERVGPMPKQGVVSAFTFGRGYGALRMALIAHRVPFECVTPQVWQAALKCRTAGDKNVSKRRAQELFPEVQKITHATADGLLLAEFARRTHGRVTGVMSGVLATEPATKEGQS